MRPITKGVEPAELATWLGKWPDDSPPNWSDFRSPEKPLVKDALLRDQGYICCYCERGIDAAHSHIEHLQSQGDHPTLRFAYSNLLASCDAEQTKGKSPFSCGHARQDQPLPIDPLMPDCGAYFVFSSSGTIAAAVEPSRQSAASQTIEVLKLDDRRLNILRHAAIVDIEMQIPDTDDPIALRAVIQELLSKHTLPDGLGRLKPFPSAIDQYLRRLQG